MLSDNRVKSNTRNMLLLKTIYFGNTICEKKLFQEALKRVQAYTVLTCLLDTHKHSTFCNMLSLL